MISVISPEPNGIEAGLRYVANLAKQTQFATAGALNQTAKDIQTFTLTGLLPSAFILRSKGQPWQKPGGKYGFNIRPFARKDSLTATIGSQADWLKAQEEGGTKSASGHRLAIVADARPGKTAVLPAALKPRVLLRNAGDVFKTRGGKERTARKSGAGFILPTKKGDAIFSRDGKVLKLMYLLASSATIKPRLHFEKKGADLANQLFPRNFSTAFARAIATAR
jgi:hypothetical protein